MVDLYGSKRAGGKATNVHVEACAEKGLGTPCSTPTKHRRPLCPPCGGKNCDQWVASDFANSTCAEKKRLGLRVPWLQLPERDTGV